MLKKLIAYVAAAFAVVMVPTAAEAVVVKLSYDGNVAGTVNSTPYDTALSISGLLDVDPSSPVPLFDYTDVKLSLPEFGVVDFALPDLQIGLLPGAPVLAFIAPGLGPVAAFALDFSTLQNPGPNRFTIDGFLVGAPPAITIGGATISNIYSEGTFTLSAVPEAATWAMMIVGFGVVGGTLRRRSSRVVLA